METTTKKPGRPIVEGSIRQQKIHQRMMMLETNGTIKRGRKIDPNSKRQTKLSKEPGKPGRPKRVEVEQ